MPDTAATASCLTHDPQRLSALCSLWRMEGREIHLTLQGGSMAPTFLPGTRLRLRCGRQEIEPGEVIAYRQGGSLVVHRVIALVLGPEGAGRRFLCLGDGNVTPDAPVPEEVVVGVVVGAAPSPLWRRAFYSFLHPRRFCRYALRVLTRRNGLGRSMPL